MKICTLCGASKEIQEFNLNRGKPGARCKSCTKMYAAEYRAKHADRAKASAAQYYSRNAEVISAKSRSKYQENPQYFREKNSRSNAKRTDAIKSSRQEYRKKNAASLSEKKRLHHEANRHLARGRDARRRASLLRAKPSWANDGAIESYYKSADMLGMLTGDWYHVDHIVPLQSDTVCGLHNEFNLQVLPAPANFSKGNRFWPGMPPEKP